MWAISTERNASAAADHPYTEIFSDYDSAYDSAFDFSVELHGQPIFIFKMGSVKWFAWTEITA
jgi:hypothetical protein